MILIISYKMLSVAGMSNQTTNEVTIYTKLCQNITIFYRQELVSSARKLESEQKRIFMSSCFTADDSLFKTVWLHLVDFTEHDILHF